MRWIVAAFVAMSWAGAIAAGEDAFIPTRQDGPPNRPYSPREAVARMTVPTGFAIELVASEPQIVNPIAMTFDDRGRVWITQSVEYPRASVGPVSREVVLTGFGRTDSHELPSSLTWGPSQQAVDDARGDRVVVKSKRSGGLVRVLVVGQAAF